MDASAVGAWELLVEHIASFAVKLMLERLSMDLVPVSLVLIVRERSRDCSDYLPVRQLCKHSEPRCDKFVALIIETMIKFIRLPSVASDL